MNRFTSTRRARAVVVTLVVAVATAAALSAAFAPGKASAQASAKQAPKYSFIWVQPMRNHPVHRLMQAGFLTECKKLNVSCEIVGNPSATNFDVPATVALVNAAMSARHFDAAAIYAVEPDIYPLIKQTSAKGLPVVSWHTENLTKGSVPGLTAVTGTVAPNYAKAAAIAIGTQVHGQGTVAITEGSFNTLENLVAKVFTQTMHKQFPKVKVLAAQVEGFEPSAAIAKAVSIIEANPGIVGAMSTTGGGSETWAGAEKQTGKKLTVIAMDYVRQNLDLVKSGAVYAIVAQPLYQEGAKTADLLYQLAQHKTVPYYNPLPAPIVTKAHLAPYYAYDKKAGE
jgi:ribose transport system substrate-binding protein